MTSRQQEKQVHFVQGASLACGLRWSDLTPPGRVNYWFNTTNHPPAVTCKRCLASQVVRVALVEMALEAPTERTP